MKKFLSLFLVLTMCMSIFPVSVFSEDETTVSEDLLGVIATEAEPVVTLTDSEVESDQLSDISLETLPLEESFDLEEAYEYYLTLEAEEAELYLASLSDDNRFMLLDYIDAMNEIAAHEAEAAMESNQLESEEIVPEINIGQFANQISDSSSIEDNDVESNHQNENIVFQDEHLKKENEEFLDEVQTEYSSIA